MIFTEAQVAEAHELAVPVELLERLDTKLGTVDAVAWLKANLPEWLGVRWGERGLGVERVSAGVMMHNDRGGAAPMPWGNIANRATIRALELRLTRPVDV